MRTPYLRARLLLVALACAGIGPSGVRAEEPEDLGQRYRVEVLVEEQRGPWRVWIERRSDLWTRVVRTTTRLLRQGPGEKDPTLLPLDLASAETAFRLHEHGWVVAAASDGVRVFAPDAATKPGLEAPLVAAFTTRMDLHVSPQSRFLSDGFLWVDPLREGAVHPRLHLYWAPLGAKGLGSRVTLAEIPDSANYHVLPEIQVRIDEEPGAWIVTWMVPSYTAPIHGRDRIDRKTHVVKRLPDPEGPPTVRVAAVQCPSVLGDVAANRARLTGLVQEAARQGAKVVVLPETAVTGYLSQDLKTNWHVPGRPRAPSFTEGRHPDTAAEDVTGASVSHFAALARRLGIYLTVPFLEVDRSQAAPRFFNTVVLVSPQGRVVAHYRKLNPWPHPEQSWAETGDKGLATFDTPYGRVGLAICFDVHSVLKPYAEKSLWALLYPIAWVSENDDADAAWFGRDLPVRVKNAGFHLVGANWSVDAPQPWTGFGHSLIVKRDGTVLASATTKVGDEIVYADLPVGR